MPSIEATIDFEVFCGKCGAGICNNATVLSRSNWRSGTSHNVSVDPCSSCADTFREEGASSRDEEVQSLTDRIRELEEELLEARESCDK